MASYEVVYCGKALSLNAVRSQHWRKTEKESNAIRDKMAILLMLAKVRFMKRYRIDTHYNSRLDPTNIVFIQKVLEDVLRRKGFIVDDNRQYCKGFSVTPDETLPPNTYRFLISEVQ